uniref:RxLR effector candidate protein n=1 Tax=Hyaloperonospora arabidopsidis (strain Emoy2) TaxID=559515 RepID=M4B2J5_HYAAE
MRSSFRSDAKLKMWCIIAATSLCESTGVVAAVEDPPVTSVFKIEQSTQDQTLQKLESGKKTFLRPSGGITADEADSSGSERSSFLAVLDDIWMFIWKCIRKYLPGTKAYKQNKVVHDAELFGVKVDWDVQQQFRAIFEKGFKEGLSKTQVMIAIRNENQSYGIPYLHYLGGHLQSLRAKCRCEPLEGHQNPYM